MVNSKIQEANPDPLFNSGISYLQRIDNVIRLLHSGMHDNVPVPNLLKDLDSFRIELCSRLNASVNKKNHKEADKLKQIVNDVKLNPNYANFLRAFEELQTSAHRHKLIMPDKQNVDSAFEEMFKR